MLRLYTNFGRALGIEPGRKINTVFLASFISIGVSLFIISVSVGIFLWKKGLKERSVFKTIFGATLCLWFLGTLISVVQIITWYKGEPPKCESKNLKTTNIKDVKVNKAKPKPSTSTKAKTTKKSTK